MSPNEMILQGSAGYIVGEIIFLPSLLNKKKTIDLVG